MLPVLLLHYYFPDNDCVCSNFEALLRKLKRGEDFYLLAGTGTTKERKNTRVFAAAGYHITSHVLLYPNDPFLHILCEAMQQ